MKLRELTRNVSALMLRADVGSVDEKARTAEMTFSTGARVLRSSYWDGPSYEELGMAPENVRMGRLQSGAAPFLTEHRASVDNVIGVITSAKLEGGKGTATVRFPPAGVDTRADQIFEKVKAGIVRSVSVGYRTHKTEKVGVEGDAKTPVFRATDWEPYEVSAVALPADADAGFRSAEMSNPCVFVTREEEGSIVDEETKKRLEAEAQAKRQAELSAEQAKRDAEVAARAVKLERERHAGLRHAAKSLGAEGDSFASKHIDAGTSVDDARKLVIDELAKRSDATAITPSGISVGEEDREKWIRGATVALLERSGMMPLITAAVASVKSSPSGSRALARGVRENFKAFDVDEDGGAFREMSLFELAKDSIERRGVKTRGLTKDQIVGRAFMERSGEASISDFSVLLENVMYKTLLGAYTQAADTWRRFCGTDSVQDFRPANRYRTGSFGTLDVISESGEYKSKAIPDGQKVQISTETKGNMISVTRQAIINDDMGAILDTIQKFGRAAGLSIEKEVYTLLAQNANLGPNVTISGTGGGTHPLFDAAWGNISTGAALSIAALDADRVAMSKQQDISSNEYLDLRPRTLLLPVGLGGLARQINEARYDVTANSAFEAPNIVLGLFKEIVDTPRLTGTRRYLFSDAVDALKVVFLNGAQAPFMDQQMGWRTDGTEYKVRIDFKAQAFDPKGALMNAGV